MNFQVTTIEKRPDLCQQAEALISDIWPTFLQQDQVAGEYWPRLYDAFPAYQTLLLTSDGETLIAVGNSIPLAWDGAEDQLPNEGWRWALAQGFKDAAMEKVAKTQCALSITLNPDFLGKGVSSVVVNNMKEIGRYHQLTRLIAPVRPNLKNRYPLIPMKQYITWQNDAGLPFDAWLRVHHRLGARIVSVCEKSMCIVGKTANWHEWTGLPMPQSGLYLVDGGLTPVKVNFEKDLGVYFEPNVWMVATLPSTTDAASALRRRLD
ncbi:MAG: GNAT family N-acetyltransferase [Chloroflexi bacterium]|nr:GNAT family N-acetyltransferase [Chloroflexota bacterium]